MGLNWASAHCSQCWGLAASPPPNPGHVGAASCAVQRFPLESGRLTGEKEVAGTAPPALPARAHKSISQIYLSIFTGAVKPASVGDCSLAYIHNSP